MIISLFGSNPHRDATLRKALILRIKELDLIWARRGFAIVYGISNCMTDTNPYFGG